MRRWSKRTACGVAAILVLLAATVSPAAEVRMLVFTAPNCPHCATQKPYLDQWSGRYPQLHIERYDIWRDREALQRLEALSRELGTGTIATPATLVGGRLWFGFDAAIARQIEDTVRNCLVVGCPDPRQAPTGVAGGEPPAALDLPLVGEVDPRRMSLPMLTVLLGLLDSINPCAFFVLLFLLSLLTHARSRRTMLLVGGVFVFCSGAVYFLFMAAWLNLFLLIGDLPAVTTGAGLLAVVVAGFNIKDFFRFHEGPSLSIPERAKPRLFGRMRSLLQAGRLPTVFFGTVVLAVVANSYELLCTAGFPMVFTRVLTLEQLPSWQYYGYLGLYNLCYILPLLVIVLAFAATLGARKLSEWQGRVLKLLSGLLMLTLGLILLLNPALLHSPAASAGALLAAVFATGAIAWLWRHRSEISG